MREIRLSGSVEGVMGNHDLYSDFFWAIALRSGRLSLWFRQVFARFLTARLSPSMRDGAPTVYPLYKYRGHCLAGASAP